MPARHGALGTYLACHGLTAGLTGLDRVSCRAVWCLLPRLTGQGCAGHVHAMRFRERGAGRELLCSCSAGGMRERPKASNAKHTRVDYHDKDGWRGGHRKVARHACMRAVLALDVRPSPLSASLLPFVHACV